MNYDLEIPTCLIRADEPRFEAPARAPRRRKAKAPDGDKVRFHLNNEIPRVGCGVRFATVAKVGRKWVTLTIGGRNHRITKRVYDSLKRVD